MSDLIYSIANTFSKDSRHGVLGQNKAECFFIAPYQRGYKWGSQESSSPIQLLMSDLTDAFNAKSKEYYLQYITISLAEINHRKILEVIDGQQRLTTLTVLFSVMAHRLPSEDTAMTNGLLTYGVRQVVSDFIQAFIYQNIEAILLTTWEDFIKENPQYDEQDIYYLFCAAQKINELLPSEEDLQGFHDFVANNVMLIINLVEHTISCEKVFANLNTNKVDLTSAELIKGLLLTKTARNPNSKNGYNNFKEIIELRTVIGRQWDEINRWCNQPAIKSFFFKNNPDPIHHLLTLLAQNEGYQIDEKNEKNKYYLFNYFQSNIKKGNKTAQKYFDKLKQFQAILNDWYQDAEIYNYLGFLFFMDKKNSIGLKDIITHLEEDKPKLKTLLRQKRNEKIPSEINKLEYGEDDEYIRRLLLALSVFTNSQKFDFHAFQKEQWSLEHIFPQHPDEFAKNLEAADIALIKTLIGEKLNQPSTTQKSTIITEDLRKSLIEKLAKESCELDDEEVKLVCDLINSDKLNSIGNMALLTRSDNSSLSNGMFHAKRMSIVRRVSQGSFAPKHTYDVFSKLLSEDMNPNLSAWTESDMEAHNKWIEKTITEITSQQIEHEPRTI